MPGDRMIDRLRAAAKHPIRALMNQARKRHCWACGGHRRRVMSPVAFQPADLIAGHGYSPEWTGFMNLREAENCVACGCNGRSRQIAETLTRTYGVRASSLSELVKEPPFRSMAIAEINQCAQLHIWLTLVPGLRYSEYGSEDPQVPHEDTLNLSYDDGSFDLVLTSDTLEHVPDCERALAEIHRILKPGGRHIFSIPVVWDQPVTERRSILRDGELVHLKPPVYHGGSIDVQDCLAFYDYGSDVLEIVRAAGFKVHLVEHRWNRALKTIVSVRL